MKDKNHIRFLHIQEAISSIRVFCQGRSPEEFRVDDLLFSAVLQKILVIGESVSRIDKDILDKYEYPWHKPRAFRNFIAHEYFQIKPERIWETIECDLISLEIIVNIIIKTEFNHQT
jgi:uncharacterized protein with HEPN domain